ncbi:Zinc finger protein [Cladobotryum mycophilum]|uniref:Zinc finger protein n=1 Tax=Cladobotryum mycophilum TaxID=491253 RepID=A0ABR0SNT4_9HYPO
MASPQPSTPFATAGSTNNNSSSSNNGSTAGYKRASRKGAPRRFHCEHSGCDKIYSRAEHLQRHQLNHNPREIYRCDVGDCDQKFVRLDLLSRHKKRHTSTYTPRNRIPSFEVGGDAPVTSPSHRSSIARSQPSQPSYNPIPAASSGPHDAAILLTPESNTAATPTSLNHALTGRASQSSTWASSLDERSAPANVMRHRSNFYDTDPTVTMPDSSGMVSFGGVPYPSDDALVQGNFAAWLFDPQTSYNEFSMASLPFLEGA